jgi:hypothetical protein
VAAAKHPGRAFSNSPQRGDGLDFAAGAIKDRASPTFAARAKAAEAATDESWEMTDTVK